MTTGPEELRDRTKNFAVCIVKLYNSLPYRSAAQVLGKQLLRSALRSLQTTEQHVAQDRVPSGLQKLIVVEEADETVFWLEMLVDYKIVSNERISSLLKEGHELSALFTASQRTARSR